MKRLLVYSHDTYGLGNIRRMVALVEHMVKTNHDLCALILSGSPMMHAFRLTAGIDYVKLPCLHRSEAGAYGSSYLDITHDALVAMRSDIILQTVRGFQPDLILVDKKPLGVENELVPTFEMLRKAENRPRIALVLREILDAQEVTKKIWAKHGYHDSLAEFYDSVFVLGPKSVFDVSAEYDFPLITRNKLRHCGYLAKPNTSRSSSTVRAELGLTNQSIVMLTAGGGQDGYRLLKTGIDALMPVSEQKNLHLLVFPGPEMDAGRSAEFFHIAEQSGRVSAFPFTNDLLSYLNASEVVVSMAGYNTVTELLMLKKDAVLVPRVIPSKEQWIRANRLAEQGYFTLLSPDKLDESTMRQCVLELLERPTVANGKAEPEMDALSIMSDHVKDLLSQGKHPVVARRHEVARRVSVVNFENYHQNRIF